MKFNKIRDERMKKTTSCFHSSIDVLRGADHFKPFDVFFQNKKPFDVLLRKNRLISRAPVDAFLMLDLDWVSQFLKVCFCGSCDYDSRNKIIIFS